MKTRNAAIAAALLVAFLASGTTNAGVVINVYQSGGNVVASASGSLDLTGLTDLGSGYTFDPGITPNDADVLTTAAGSESPFVAGVEFYTGYSGPASLGPGGPTGASSESGDALGINVILNGTTPVLVVPLGYASGTPLSATDTFDGTTIAGMGLTPGIYNYTWGTGPGQIFTINVAPEPSTLLLGGMAVGFGLIAAWRRRRP
jgi:hypothetical protein